MLEHIRSLRRVFECFLVVLLLVGITPHAHALDTINVVVYGDSLTSGYKLPPEESYASQLEKKLIDLGYINVKVINMSQAGETSSGGLERVSSLVLKEPDVVVLELGANDILRGIDANFISANLAHIIRMMQNKGAYVVLIGMYAPPNLGADYSAKIANMYINLATNFRVAFYPFALDGIYGKAELNLADGYHPNGKGIELMVEKTYRLVDAGVRWKYQIMLQQEGY